MFLTFRVATRTVTMDHGSLDIMRVAVTHPKTDRSLVANFFLKLGKNNVYCIVLQDKSATVGSIMSKLGWAGVWKGLGPRIIMIGTLTGLQWFIYDAVKVS